MRRIARASSLRTAFSLAALAASLVGLGLATSQAAAFEGHPFRTSFDGSDSTAGAFSILVNRIAVDQASGAVYVIDRGTGALSKFDADGTASDFAALGASSIDVPATCSEFSFGEEADVAVDSSEGPGKGNIYVQGENSGLCAFSSSGELLWRLGGIGYTCGVATDADGHVWVGIYGGGGGALEFDNTGSPPAQIDSVPGSTGDQVCHLTPDSLGNLYMQQYNGRVDKFAIATGNFLSVADPGPARTVAIDPVTDHLFVGFADRVKEYTPSGALFSQIGVGFLQGAVGIGVNGTSGEVYISEFGQVHVYGRFEISPDATTGETTQILSRSATVNGEVDPDGSGEIGSCLFEYGTSSGTYGESEPCSELPASAAPAQVSADLSDLDPGTTYYYRLRASSPGGTGVGPERSFSTPYVAGVQTNPVTGATQTEVTLNGSLNPEAGTVHYYFEWGPDTSYGTTTSVPPGDGVASGNGSEDVSAVLGGLETFTPTSGIYHYRLVATSSAGTTYGPDRIFHTAPPERPAVSGPVGAPTGPTGAVLSAEVSPHGGDTIVLFEYGTDQSYGSTASSESTISPEEPSQTVSAELTGLEPGTTYHFRAVAINFGGTTHGPDRTFSTPGAPAVSEASASEVTSTGARLAALVRPGFRPTTYRFEYGTTAGYGQRTPESVSIGADNAGRQVSASIDGLSAGTTYHFRIVATNSVGVTESVDRTFETAPAPLVAAPPQRAKCKRGFVKRRGKCVKKRTGKRRTRR